MAVVTVKAAIFVSRLLTWITLQLSWKRQGPLVLDLHQDLVQGGIQRSEAREPSFRGLKASFILPLSRSRFLSSLVLLRIFQSLSFSRLFFPSQQCVFRIHVFGGPIEYLKHGLRVIFI